MNELDHTLDALSNQIIALGLAFAGGGFAKLWLLTHWTLFLAVVAAASLASIAMTARTVLMLTLWRPKRASVQ